MYLIDAMAFCYRAFYAVPELTTSSGQPTNAIYGFINILNKILKEKKPDYIGICFDVSRDTFRQKKFAEYKIQRPPMPDRLSSQLPFVKEVISAYRIPILQKEGYEADDVIATASRKARVEGVQVVVVSSDKDVLQLVDDNTQVFSPYKDEGIVYDRKKVEERFGAGPEKIADIIALMGDNADNIPGVPGVGEKTAVGLVREFDSLKELIDSIGRMKEGRLKQSLLEYSGRIKLNKELAVLDKNVDLDFDLGQLKVKEPDFKELARLFKRLEFKKFLRGLPPEEVVEAAEIKAHTVKAQEFKKMAKESKEIILCGESAADLAFSVDGKILRLGSAGEELGEVLADPQIRKAGYDLKKIKVGLAKEGLNLEGMVFDAMVGAYLLNPSRPGYALSDLSWEYLPKTAQSGNTLELVRLLRPKIEKELKEKQLLELFTELEMPLVEVLAEMEQTGIKIDLKVLSALSHDIEERLVRLIGEIYELSGSEFNINSPKQLRTILFEKLKLPVVKKTKTGPSTDEEVLNKLADKHKLPAYLLEYRQLTKLKNTYIDAFPELVDKDTGRVHTSFNQTVTETGRLSSSNPNLQNIPIKTDIGRKIRKAIVCSNDTSYLLSCDYSQVELRILAHLSGDENLSSAFKKDKDVHCLTASLIYELDESEVTDEMRETAKRVNFGIIYGQTSYGLSRDLGIPVDQAQQFINAYFLRYPDVHKYIEKQIKEAQHKGFVVTLSGRRRYIPEINSKNQGIRQFAQRQAVNTPIQGSASDLIKLAMVAVHKQMRKKGLKSKMLMQIHDELVFDICHEELGEMIELTKKGMEGALKLNVPIRVDIKKGKNWLEMEEVR